MTVHGLELLKAPQKASILIVCAHRWEAQGFLNLGSFKSLQGLPFPHPLYAGEDGAVLVLVCGQGPLNAAIAVGTVLSHLGGDREQILLANYGLAGCPADSFELGQSLLINKVGSAATGQNFYPERLIKSELKEGPCFSFDRPVTTTLPGFDQLSPTSPKFLVDMESFAICRAAEGYLSSSQILLGKFVSDFIADELPDLPELVAQHQESYANCCENFLRLCREQLGLLQKHPRSHSWRLAQSWAFETQAEIEEHWHLTTSQTRHLHKILLSCALERPNKLISVKQELSTYLASSQAENKDEVKLHLKKLEALCNNGLVFESSISL